MNLLVDLYNDRRLAGDFLVAPFRTFATKFSNLTNSFHPYSGIIKRTAEVFKRVLLFILAIAVLPLTALMLTVGMPLKFIHRALRADQLYSKKTMITTHFNPVLEHYSRLGDRLVAYMHAKHFGHEAGLPLLYKPFKGENMFDLKEKEIAEGSAIYDPEAPLYFKKVVYLEKDDDLNLLQNINPNESVLYVLPYFPESKIEKCGGYTGIKKEVSWEKKEIKEINRRMLKVEHLPTNAQPLDLPKGAFAIAVHLRTGGDFDGPDTASLFPAKLPTRDFYYGELENVIRNRVEHTQRNQIGDKKNVFIHIFTDSTNAQGVKDDVAAELTKRGIIQLLEDNGMKLDLSFREKASVAEDFNNMSKPFDCFIHPDSNMSGTISKYSDYPLEIYPSHYRIADTWKETIVDRVEYAVRNSQGVKRTHEEQRDYRMKFVRRWFLPLLFYKLMHRNFLGAECPK